jgi:hypothetical protein
MKQFRKTSAAGNVAAIAALAFLGTGVSRADESPFRPGAVVESKLVRENPSSPLDTYIVNVHTILQVHPTPIAARRATQDLSALTACQNGVIATSLFLAGKGVNAVVVEGRYASGTLANPVALQISAVPRGAENDPKWALVGREGLAVYGSAIKFLDDFMLSTVNDLGRSSALAQSMGKSESHSVAQVRAMETLVQEEITRLGLWHAGIVPAQSFIGLQTALAVALARNTKQVQLIIGKEHWPDLVYAINRQKDIRIRLVPYWCP